MFLSPARVVPGQTLEVEALLSSRSVTPVDGIELALSGIERLTNGPNERFLGLQATFEPAKLSEGEHAFRARFPIPPDALPSHRGWLSSVVYELTVHVDIPWWPDVDRSFVVEVAHPPVTATPTEVVFNSREGDVKGKELYAEATLATAVVAPGGALTGAVSFGNTRGLGRTSVSLSFVGIERAGGQVSEAHRFTAKLPHAELVDGEPVPFRVTLPSSAPPTFRGRRGVLDWFFVVATNSGWSQKPILRIPIQVLPRTGEDPRLRVGAIGRARRAGMWSAAASAAGWDYDEQRDMMQRRFGDLVATIAVEQRTAGGPHVVGTIELGDLGLDLEMKPSSWVAALASSRIETGQERLDGMVSTHAREAAQALSLLRGDLADALALAEELRVDDARAVLSWAGGGVDDKSVRRALAVVDGVAKLFAHRMESMSPPARFVEHLEAWRSLAARMGGKLRRGRPEIVGAERLGRPIRLFVEWTEADAPCGIVIEARRGPDSDDRSPSKRALAARAALEAAGRVTVEPDRVMLALADPACDLERAEPHVDAVAELVALLEDRADQGPYR